MKIFAAIFFVVFNLCAPAPASACETKHLTIVGNLDRSTPLASLIQIPDINTHPTFAALEAPSHYATSFSVFDSLGVSHVVTNYFYQVSPRIWNIFTVVDGSEVVGGTPGTASSIGPDSGLQFDSSGVRLSVGTPDITLVPAWSGGAAVGSIKLIFGMTQLEAVSSIASISQDGRIGDCARRSDLDFDGDGIEDYAIWRPQFGIWAVLKSSTSNTGFIFKQWGLPGDHPMPGDYSGDQRADLVVWRPADGNWYICRSETQFDCAQPIIQQFGLPGDRPIRGDFDGDGVLDFAVWRPTSGTFYYKGSGSGQIIARQWGLPGDIPLNTGENR